MPAARDRLARRRVVIVEDDEVFARPLERALEVAGFAVRRAVTAEEAIELVRAHGADVVLTDQRLPGMSGSELASRLAALVPAVRVILMSGEDPSVEPHPSVADRLRKPFDLDRLLEAVSGSDAARGESRASSTRSPAAAPAPVARSSPP